VCDRNATGIGNVLSSKWNVNNESEYLQTLDGDLRMKKSLFALAALGAFAGAAQAQSSVTLYGTIDMAITNVTNGGMAAGATAPTSPTASPVAGNVTAMTDYGLFSNVWGLKGSEDLGGGLKAVFNLESDLNALNGTIYNNSTNTYNQLFRRAANVGLSGNWGEARVGVQLNPLVAASANLMPVMGNTVNSVRTTVGYSIGDFMANAISYQTPNLNGLTAKVVYSLNNQVDDMSGGSVIAANALYSQGALDITAGYNKQTSTNAAASTVYTDLSSNANVNNPKFPGDLTGYVVGLKYKVTPTLQVGYGYGHSDYNSGSSAATATPTIYNGAVQMLGIGYNATPSLLLGANYLVTTLDSSMMNLQARYSLSKRTMLYSQVSRMANGAGAYTKAGAQAAFGNFGPVQTDTSGAPTAVAGLAGLQNTTATAIGFGIVHMF